MMMMRRRRRSSSSSSRRRRAGGGRGSRRRRRRKKKKKKKMMVMMMTMKKKKTGSTRSTETYAVAQIPPKILFLIPSIQLECFLGMEGLTCVQHTTPTARHRERIY